MFETLINPSKAERKPWEMFFVGFFYAAFAMLIVNIMFVGNPVFESYASMLIITFTVILSLPFMYFTIRLEEEKDAHIHKEAFLIKEHGKALMCFIFLFLGFVTAYSMAFVILPKEIVNKNFDSQILQFCTMNMPGQVDECVKYHKFTGKATEPTGKTAFAQSMAGAFSIFSHNIYVLIFCILFSLAFGAGAIFILTWNATVIATAMGIFAESRLVDLPAAFARYLIHGTPEIAAYFTAGLAGGIISVAIIRHNFEHERFWHILQDSLDLIIFSFIILFLAALIEVFITPAIF